MFADFQVMSITIIQAKLSVNSPSAPDMTQLTGTLVALFVVNMSESHPKQDK
jgi:hypothetical protein